MDADVEQILAVAELTTELLGNAGSAMGLYITITSGYLLVAYLAGKYLTRLQTVIISVLFIVLATFNTIAVVSYFENAFYFGHTYGAGRVPYWPVYGMGTLFSLGILACLKFMWDVRHPKTE
jgi:hypothetical protein